MGTHHGPHQGRCNPGAQEDPLALARHDLRHVGGDLLGDEGSAAPGRLVVEEDAVAGEPRGVMRVALGGGDAAVGGWGHKVVELMSRLRHDGFLICLGGLAYITH